MHSDNAGDASRNDLNDSSENIIDSRERIRVFATKCHIDPVSDELAIRYRFKVDKGALSLRVGNRGWERLQATIQDEFIPHQRRRFDNRIFSFVRDTSGQIIACRVSLWRIKGIRFRKLML